MGDVVRIRPETTDILIVGLVVVGLVTVWFVPLLGAVLWVGAGLLFRIGVVFRGDQVEARGWMASRVVGVWSMNGLTANDRLVERLNRILATRKRSHCRGESVR